MNNILTIDCGADNVCVLYRVSWVRSNLPLSKDFTLRQRAIDYFMVHHLDIGVSCMHVDEKQYSQ